MPTRVKDILFGTLAPSEKGPAMSQLELSRDGARMKGTKWTGEVATGLLRI